MANKKEVTEIMKVQDDALEQSKNTVSAEQSELEKSKQTSDDELNASTKENETQKEEKPKTIEEQYRELILANYAANYPQNKEWHVTSDRAVFLADDLHHAENYQRTLKEGKVITIKTK